MKTIMLLTMIFLHIVDDYYLQGILASMKQKSWWQSNAPDPLYKNDYKVALIEHAFSWTFMIMLPSMILMIVNNEYYIAKLLVIFILNCLIHALIDNLKANVRIINLVQDQTTHLIQVIITWLIMM